MRRTSHIAGVAAVIPRAVMGAVVVLLTMAGCQRFTGTPGTPASPRSTGSPTQQPTPMFQMPANVCTAMAFDAFADLYPNETPDATESMRIPLDGFSYGTARCSAGFGNLKDGIVVSAMFYFFSGTGDAKFHYEVGEGVDAKQYRVTQRQGLGTAAHTFTDAYQTSVLMVFHGNLHLRLAVTGVVDRAAIPSDVHDRLARVATHIFTHLPTTETGKTTR